MCDVADPFRAAGDLRREYAQVNWGASALGPIADWSPTLRHAVDLMLGSRFPVALLWGPELVLVYNAAYVEMIGAKHPDALGRPAAEVFPEAWSIVGPMLHRVLAGDGADLTTETMLPMRRRGYLEHCWFTFSYSPVCGPDGEVEGILDIATETTAQVVLGRRLQLLARLGEALAPIVHAEEVVARTLEVLRSAPDDVADVAVGPLPDGLTGGVGPRDAAWVWNRLPSSTESTWSHLGIRLNPFLPHDEDYLTFVGLLVRAVDQALGRAAAIEEERSLSEALQRSLLSAPPEVDGLQVAVRYQAALEVARVGGDWYDAFRLPDGALAVVVGDVAGHDENATAAMAQLRNLTRGVAVTRVAGPGVILADLDGALVSLGLPVVATAVLGQVRAVDGAEHLALEWSNAGHPPPVLIGPDGVARLLERPPELLLGLHPGEPRGSHAVVLEPGSTLLLYSDGLVERRGVPLDESLAWLVEEVTGRHQLDPDELCDHLLGAIGRLVDDDVVLLALRVVP